MKTIRDPSQERLFDPFEGVIGKAGRKQIESGWQSLFRDVLLKQLPVQRLGKDLSSDMGRPTAELHAMIGLLFIREFHGWTVPQTHEAILFRADVQYALNLEPGIDITQRNLIGKSMNFGSRALGASTFRPFWILRRPIL